ncbi:hypothetical protein [Novosphingobium sp.]|jgi:hypothetical protein|uniref:hypothetical protein n=1 Tax=Novosphingobium sp. TaxID=1874826 RepID=UPI002FDD74AC
MEQSRDMATNCLRLDRSRQALASYRSALRRYDGVVTTMRGGSAAAMLAKARQRWKSSRADVDTSCIVGPQETPRTAYASLISDFDRATAAVRRMLAAGPGGS